MGLLNMARRVVQQDSKPQKSVDPVQSVPTPVAPMVAATAVPADPVTSAANRLTAQQLANLPLGYDIQNGLFSTLGGYGNGNGAGFVQPWMTQGLSGVANESGAEGTIGATVNWDALSPYSFEWTPMGGEAGTLKAFDSKGNAAGSWTQQKQSALGSMLEWAGLAGAGFGLAGLAGLGPLAAAGAAGGAASNGAGTITGGSGLTAGGSTYGTIGGTLGGSGGTTLGIAGNGLSAGAGLTSPTLQALASAGGLLPAAPVTPAVPQPPVTQAPVPQTPAIQQPSVFNAAADSQAYNQAAGITGQQAAAAAKVPVTVNLTNAGGTMATAGGVKGAIDLGAQVVRDAVSGTPLSGVGGAVADAAQATSKAVTPAAQWLKDNPTLGRLLLGAGTSLLMSSGGSGSATPARTAVNPKQWNTPIQMGLLSPVQQYFPAPVQTRPAGLLADGFQADGAWRYLRG